MLSESIAIEPNRPISVSEVAAVTDVEPKIVNRFIDDKVLPPTTYRRKKNERTVYSFACPIIGFYSSEAGSSLTKETRREVADWLAERLKSDWNSFFTFGLFDEPIDSSTAFARLVEDQLTLMRVNSVFEPDTLKFIKGALALDLTKSVRSSLECLFKLRLAEALMVDDPDIRGGVTTIKGTRISPYEAASVALADGIESATESYSSLSPQVFELAILYSKANPLRGRPSAKEGDWRKDWRLVSEKTVPLSEYVVQGA